MRNTLTIGMLAVLTGCGGLTRYNQEVEAQEANALLGIVVTPGNVQIPVGGSVQLEAIGLFDESEDDVTYQVAWLSDDATVAFVSDDFDLEGTLFGVAEGQVEITATLDGVQSSPTLVTVSAEAPTELRIEPGDLILEQGQAFPLEAIAITPTGASYRATEDVRWITEDPSVLTLDQGMAMAMGVGETSLTVQLDELTSAPIRVTVLEPYSEGGEAIERDLVVTDLRAQSSGGTTHVSVELLNPGIVAAGAFYVDVYLDRSGPPSLEQEGDDWVQVSSLAPGEGQTLTFELATSCSGCSVYVLVDSFDEVGEDLENNNVAGPIFAD